MLQFRLPRGPWRCPSARLRADSVHPHRSAAEMARNADAIQAKHTCFISCRIVSDPNPPRMLLVQELECMNVPLYPYVLTSMPTLGRLGRAGDCVTHRTPRQYQAPSLDPRRENTIRPKIGPQEGSDNPSVFNPTNPSNTSLNL